MKENEISVKEYLDQLMEYKIRLLSTEVTMKLGVSASVLGCLDFKQIKGKFTIKLLKS